MNRAIQLVDVASFWQPFVFLVIGLVASALVKDRRKSDLLILVSLYLPFIVWMDWLTLKLLTVKTSARYDLYINAIDGLLGHPGNLVAAFFQKHLLLSTVAYGNYYLYVAFPFVAIALTIFLRDYEEARRSLFMFALCVAMAIPFYFLIPVAGPRYSVPNFPDIYSGPAFVVHNHAAPNGVPSVHFSLCLIVFYLLRHWRWGKVAGIANILMTIYFTLGSGEHFVFDLVLAVPYTWAIATVSLMQRRAAIPCSTTPSPIRQGFR